MSQYPLPFVPSSGTVNPVVPSSGASSWLTVIEDGGLFVADAAHVRSTEQITHASRRIFTRAAGFGTTLFLRMRYFASTVDIGGAGPIVKLFGASDDDLYAPLRNIEGDQSIVISYDKDNDPYFTLETPHSAIEYNVTVPENTTHAWDCAGCTRFMVAVERAVSGDPQVGEIVLEAKII